MLSKTFAALAAAVACTLMACSSAQGPTESTPGGSASSSSDVEETGIVYTCNGTRYPCSYEKLVEIHQMSSWDVKAQSFRLESSPTIPSPLCQVCGDPANPGATPIACQIKANN